MTVTGLALANWLADAAVLAVSIRATGAAVPWHDLLLVYGSGIAAQSLNITPGGLGVAEGTLSLALIATGLRAGQALAAVLLYRLASFWLVAFAGWLVLLWLRRTRYNAGPVRTPGGGGGRARQRRPQMREPLGQAASRTSGGAAVRAGGMAADAMDRPCPAGPDRLAAWPPAASRRARQLASLGPSGPPAHPALAHVPDRATRPSERTG
jgi:Lysylphosphatidylglycerol synthase TM region